MIKINLLYSVLDENEEIRSAETKEKETDGGG